MKSLALVALVVTAACGAASYRSARAPSAPAMTAEPPVDRSLFARDPGGQLSEDALQRLLSSPVELEMPARVGVLPIVTAEDWRGPSPDWRRVPAGVAAFAAALRGAEPFTLVTEMLPIPSGALGMEALREAAARYALRYVLLYREGIRQRERLSGVAALYATVVGMLFLPGQTLEVDGYMEASLLDVKTGLLLFTVRRNVNARRSSNLWYTGSKLEALQARVATRFAPELASDVRGDVARFAEAVRAENDRKAAALR
jgi:hypothetical protein